MILDRQAQLRRLSQVRLMTEDDVREEFITPLLRLLGYDHARGEIKRGESLSTPYKSGTKRKEYVIPDYVTEFEDVVHLAIEAKVPGASIDQGKQIATDRGYVGQVHSYAAHREVQAPLFIISNGQFTAVYETSRTDFDPVLLLSQDAIESRFHELEDLISKGSMCRIVSHRLPLAWEVPIRHREVGFQPMNLAVGDINQDGLPEIAIALSENHIPIVDHRGEQIATIETDGWVWWVKCTGAEGSDEATLVAIQMDRGSRGTTSKLLGINGSRLLWEHHLPRAGSGFEELDRIVIDLSRGALVFGVACDNIISSLTLRGEVLWSTRITTETAWRSVMHVRHFRGGRSVLVTSGGQSNGVIAELDTFDGNIRQLVELPFRGAQIEFLDNASQRLMVANADAAQIAIVDWRSAEIVSVIDLPFGKRNPGLAVDSEGNAIVITGMGHLRCYRISDINTTLPEPTWETDEVRGHINRLLWIRTSQGSRLLVSTCGSAARPWYNGIYLLTPTGEVNNVYHFATANEKYGLTGIRDVKAANLSRPSDLDIVAIADDSHLYVWNPHY